MRLAPRPRSIDLVRSGDPLHDLDEEADIVDVRSRAVIDDGSTVVPLPVDAFGVDHDQALAVRDVIEAGQTGHASARPGASVERQHERSGRLGLGSARKVHQELPLGAAEAQSLVTARGRTPATSSGQGENNEHDGSQEPHGRHHRMHPS
jgi:hypothetical protein